MSGRQPRDEPCRRSPTTAEIRAILQHTSIALDRALHDDSRPEDPDTDLRVATYAVHRALVALGPTERADWRPPRVVALTIDEAVVALGVIQLLGDAAEPELRELAERATAVLHDRVLSVGAVEIDLRAAADG